MKAVKRGTRKPPSPSRYRTKDLFDLESDLCDAVNMAGIVAELAEDKLSGDGEVTLQPEEAELILFAIYEAYQRMEAVRDRYLKLEH